MATVVFYDGVCALCNRLIRFLVARDRRRQFYFAPLQGTTARTVLTPRGIDPSALDTMYVIADWQGPSERVLSKSRTILYALSQLGGGWALVARAAALVPRPIADALYGAVARRRYRAFGRLPSCPLPPPGWKDRFLD